jgi:hypothetical protein
MTRLPVSLEELASSIRRLGATENADLEGKIEAYLKTRLQHLSSDQRLMLLEELTDRFKAEGAGALASLNVQTDDLARLVSLLLGKRVSVTDLSSTELSQKLAQSLNTVFDMLNKIVGVIHTTLLGQKTEQETIRQIIGLQIETEASDTSLQNYLDQIRDAFLAAHKAFRRAAEATILRILEQFDPDTIASSAEGHLKFGPLRKAELFDLYKEKFGAFKESFDSGRLMEQLMRDFEKACENLYMLERRRSH